METRNVPHFPAYAVTDTGRVWSHKRQRFLKAQRGKHYASVTLRKDGKSYTKPVYIIVAEAFLGPRPTGKYTRRLDGDYFNDALTNLAYGTYAEHLADRVKAGARPAHTHCPKGHVLNGRRGDGRRYCLTCNRDRRVSRRTQPVPSGTGGNG